jgi:ABC-type phosphate/phosphonate transport system permease subunit
MGSGAIGACNNGNQDITIEADLHFETQASVLVHEAFEAINSSMNLNLRHKTISALETAWYGVLVQNPSWWGDRRFSDDDEVPA